MTRVDNVTPPAAPQPKRVETHAPAHAAPQHASSVGPAVKVTLSKEAQAIVKGHK